MTKKVKTYLVSLEKQSNGTYIAYNKEYDNTCIGEGSSVQAAKEDFFRSLSEMKQAALETGMKVPEICELTPNFKFDVSSLFEYYSVLNMGAFAERIGINASLMRQYKMGGTYISEKQLAKIEQGINNLGRELASVKLV